MVSSRERVRVIMAFWLVCLWHWEEGVLLGFVTCLGKERDDRRTGDGQMALSSEAVHCHSIQSAQVCQNHIFYGIIYFEFLTKIIREIWKYILSSLTVVNCDNCKLIAGFLSVYIRHPPILIPLGFCWLTVRRSALLSFPSQESWCVPIPTL